MNEVQCREYLDRMGYTGEVAHTPQCLNQLILAHLAAIPFENLDVCEDHLIPSLDVEDLFEKITNQNFVPVVDDNGIFIGIVTRKDVLLYLAGKLRNH